MHLVDLGPIGRSAAGPVELVRQWATASQQQACRNAMIASTALTARRVERDAIAEEIAVLLAPQVAPPAAPAAARLG